MHLHRDERGVIVGWLLKLVLVLGVVGALLFDGVAVAVNVFGLDSTAADIANALSTSVSTADVTNQLAVEQAARDLAKDAGARLVRVKIDPVERILRVKLARRAKTLVLGRVGALEDWTKTTAVGTSSTG